MALHIAGPIRPPAAPGLRRPRAAAAPRRRSTRRGARSARTLPARSWARYPLMIPRINSTNVPHTAVTISDDFNLTFPHRFIGAHTAYGRGLGGAPVAPWPLSARPRSARWAAREPPYRPPAPPQAASARAPRTSTATEELFETETPCRRTGGGRLVAARYRGSVQQTAPTVCSVFGISATSSQHVGQIERPDRELQLICGGRHEHPFANRGRGGTHPDRPKGICFFWRAD